MSISIKDVEKIAKLARLTFDENEKKKITNQLAEILNYVEKLKKIDTENIPPTYNVHNITNVLREDKAEFWLSQEEAVENAPKNYKGYFSVPKVINFD